MITANQAFIGAAIWGLAVPITVAAIINLGLLAGRKIRNRRTGRTAR